MDSKSEIFLVIEVGAVGSWRQFPPNTGQMEKDFSAKVPFSALCDLFERLFLSSKASKKKGLLQTFFKHYRSHQFHALLRLILPQLDKERQTYGMKETNLGKYYVELLNISPESEDGRRLLHWRRPTKAGELEAGDFGNAVFLSLQNRCQKEGSLSLHHINKCLDQLNSTTERKDKLNVLKWMLRRTTAREQKWFVRIIVKELKIGMSEKTVLNTFHPDALDLYQATSSLMKVANELTDPSIRIENAQGSISLFHPVKPQLAARKNPEEVVTAMKGLPFAIEKKFDGERIQIHKDGNQVRLFSRNSNDVTSIYGKTVIPNILKYVKVAQCILDGELLVWDSLAGNFEPFGRLKTYANFERQRGKNSGDSGDEHDSAQQAMNDIGSNLGKQLCIIVFDVLLVNEKVVTNLTLQQRLLLVKRCVEHTDKVLEVVSQQIATTTDEVVAALDQAITLREEGIMVKSLNSTYVPNERKDKWIKLKPEYIDGIVSDLDLLILGGYYGTGIGRRGGTISHFLLGIPKPKEDGEEESDKPGNFLSFCKVGSGYSDQELKVLQKMLEKHWRVFDANAPPSCIELVPPCKEKPDVWIEPQHSRIVQVKAAQLVPTEKFMTRWTLRFPRVQKLRLDKNWTDSMTWEELQQLTTSCTGLSSKRMRDVENIEPKQKKRKPATRTTIKSLQVLKAYQAADTTGLDVVDSLFEGKEFCVLTGNLSHSKEQLEKLIFQHSGKRVQNPTAQTSYVIAEKMTLRVTNLIQGSTHDIIKPPWILESIRASKLIPLEPKFMVHVTGPTMAIFRHSIDEFGDHYTRDVTAESVKQILQGIGDSHLQHVKEFTPAQKSAAVSHLERKYFTDVPWWSIFRRHVFYLHSSSEPDSEDNVTVESHSAQLHHLISFYGGHVVTSVGPAVTHILVLNSTSQERKQLRATQFSAWNTAKVLSSDWVLECAEQHENLDERDYF